MSSHISPLSDVANTPSKRRLDNVEEPGKRSKREAAVKAERRVQDHYSTSFEDLQVASQDWSIEIYRDAGVSPYIVEELKGDFTVIKPHSKVKTEEEPDGSCAPQARTFVKVEEDVGPSQEMRLIHDWDLACLRLEAKLTCANGTIQRLEHQLKRIQELTTSTLRRQQDEVAQMKSALDEACAARVVAERVLEAQRKERDHVIMERDAARKELRSFKAKLSKLVGGECSTH
ncbi:hypothetical protein L218DRAFT_1081124 [Marasmius fiardii PR-910]|nr:hypothetical protein L218DRAFT_1081124 [Marasmius fiardii PR-910]